MCQPPIRIPIDEQMFIINNTNGKIKELLNEIKQLKKQLKEAIEINEFLLKQISIK